MRSPFVVFLLSFIALWLSVRWGISLRKRLKFLDDERDRADFNVVQAATLTLLGIIIGFSFSMALSRYDQRKNYEELETNTIGTEFLRLDLLPGPDAAAAQQQLKQYLEQRIAWYTAIGSGRRNQVEHDTEQVQKELWSTVRKSVEGKPAGVVTLTVSGLNEAFDSQGYTQAAWLNRIPPAAWAMMGTIAFFGSVMIGIGVHRRTVFISLVAPLVISVSFFLIADLDSPRLGLIRVHPEDLLILSRSLSRR
jgi:hypothetical protein